MNYKSFGFTKIIPRIPADKFEVVVQNSANKNEAVILWEKVTSPRFLFHASAVHECFASAQGTHILDISGGQSIYWEAKPRACVKLLHW